MIKLLSGNEALAWGAYHSGVKVAAAYPGTPSTEILEAISHFDDIYAEWSTNEKVAMEVALGAVYAGVRSLASMKQVGFNVATDPFMAVATTGVNAGMVVICADDPGVHSSQGEQDNRHYAKLAKVALLEPADSQEAYDYMALAYDLSEQYDTPVIMRSTTRISHSKSVVDMNRSRVVDDKPLNFTHNIEKYVMLPVYTRMARPLMEERLVKLAEYAETTPLNKIIEGNRKLGIVSSGVAYQYAREVFPKASFLKLGMTYPLPRNLIRKFASQVDRLIAIEELDPFLQENILMMGVEVTGKEFIPRIGELTPDIVEESCRKVGLLPDTKSKPRQSKAAADLPKRPPLLCPGCPHTGIHFVLSTAGKRDKLLKAGRTPTEDSELVITGDIGCYTLGALPPIYSIDTTSCMGAGIGEALGMEKAGMSNKVVAIIGDSTFLHSGITGLVNGIYDNGKITVIIMDNGTTAMTGHQEHPGTGISAQGKPTKSVDIESLVRGIGINDVKVVDSFNIKELRSSFKSALNNDGMSVLIVRGQCSVRVKERSEIKVIDVEKCDQCNVCLRLGCPAIQSDNGQVFIDKTLCAGRICGLCVQVCPHKAIT